MITYQCGIRHFHVVYTKSCIYQKISRNLVYTKKILYIPKNFACGAIILCFKTFCCLAAPQAKILRYICCKYIFSSHKMCLEMEFSSQFSQTKHALFWYIQEFVLVSSIKISYILFSLKNLLYTKSCIYHKISQNLVYTVYKVYTTLYILCHTGLDLPL